MNDFRFFDLKLILKPIQSFYLFIEFDNVHNQAYNKMKMIQLMGLKY
jgi:hypothetical protein